MGLAEDIEQSLLDGDYSNVADDIMKPENRVLMDKEGMHIMSKVFDIGLRTAFTLEQIQASETLLCGLCEIMPAKEAILTLLEQIEMVDLENKLYSVLNPLRCTLERLPIEKWETNVKWALQVIAKRQAELPVPSTQKLQTTAKIEAAENPTGILTKDVFVPVQEFLNFYSYCLAKVLNNFSASAEKILDWKVILRLHVLRLLGFPLAVCPFYHPREQKADALPPRPTLAAKSGTNVVTFLNELGMTAWNYNHLLNMNIQQEASNRRSRKRSKPKQASSTCEEEPELDFVALGGYLLLVHMSMFNRGGPSSPTQDAITGFYLISKNLESESFQVQLKGLQLAEMLLNELCPRTPYHRLKAPLLLTTVHLEFISQLTHVFTYSDYAEIRKRGAFVFKSYLWAFDADGRYEFINAVLNNMSGYSDSLIGFIITQLKEFTRQGLEKLDGKTTLNCMGKDEPLLPEIEVYFLGKRLESLLKLTLKVTNGPQTDLVSCDAQILSSLNLIRFLLMRDGKSNKSGIVTFQSSIVDGFLKDVRKSMDMTILHTRTRLKELEDPSLMEWETKQMHENKCEMFLKDTAGVQLSYPEQHSPQQQSESCKHILSKMDMLGCVLAHTVECYENLRRATS